MVFSLSIFAIECISLNHACEEKTMRYNCKIIDKLTKPYQLIIIKRHATRPKANRSMVLLKSCQTVVNYSYYTTITR